jgi:hypothetical protein
VEAADDSGFTPLVAVVDTLRQRYNHYYHTIVKL